MKKKLFKVENFTKFTAFEGGDKINIRYDADGKEEGFEVSGLLTTFDVENENGMKFENQSYTRFVTDYFIKNSLNVPVCLLHDDTDIRNVCGNIETMEKRDDGVYITAFVPRETYYYTMIKKYIQRGILQGFSNAGGIIEGSVGEDGVLNISEFALIHAAIVCTPADTGAKFVAKNTVFKGFDNNKTREETPAEADGLTVADFV